MAMPAPAPVQISWYDQVKGWMEDFLVRLNIKSVDFVQVLIYAGVGFISGFLLKRYFRTLFWALIVSALFFGALHYWHIITIDFDRLKAMLGLAADRSFEWYLSSSLEWVKNNIVLAVSGFLGFVIGYKSA